MKHIGKIILSMAFGTCLLCGCGNQSGSNDGINKEHISESETTSSKKNTFFPSAQRRKKDFI